MNIDELMEQMRLDEEGDAEWMTPIRYARHRGLHPQQVYAWLRQAKFEHAKKCDCGGHWEIYVPEADEFLRSKGKLPPPEGGDEEDAENRGEELQ
jgi:hypothetical protein